jgi:serine/threonine protein kinase
MAPKQIIFDRFYLNRTLGRGGMGIVWQAYDFRLDRDVALKFLPDTVTFNPDALEDLKRETRRSLQLTHPHIIRIYDLAEDENWACISMEYVEGSNLSALQGAQPNHCFEIPDISAWVWQLIEGLEYAHTRAKVIHRDLKPGNLMISNDSELKIADFGISRTLIDSESKVTSAADASGTLPYMSPQQARGLVPTVADDIYSLGATLYDLLSSRPPFFTGDIGLQVQKVSPPSITQRRIELDFGRPPLDQVWEETIAACLAKDPALRPSSVAEVKSLLFTHLVQANDFSSKEQVPWSSHQGYLRNSTRKLTNADEESVPPSISPSDRNFLIIIGIAFLIGIAFVASMLVGVAPFLFDGIQLLKPNDIIGAPGTAERDLLVCIFNILSPILLLFAIYYLRQFPLYIIIPVALLIFFALPAWFVVALVFFGGILFGCLELMAGKYFQISSRGANRAKARHFAEIIRAGGYNRARLLKPDLKIDGNIVLRYPELFINGSPFDLSEAVIRPEQPNILLLANNVRICLYQGPTDAYAD